MVLLQTFQELGIAAINVIYSLKHDLGTLNFVAGSLNLNNVWLV